jgi:hypothetical protein
MTTLEQLRAQAPRSFDKTLIDLLVAIQHGHAPIQIADPPAVVEIPRDVAPAVLKLAAELDRALDRIRRLESVIARLAIEAARDAA